MPGTEIRPLSAHDLDPAAALLAARHRRQRATEPLLADRDDFRAQIERALAEPEAAGVVAEREGRVTGYLVGHPFTNEYEPEPMIVVGFAGQAAEQAETMRDLYAALAAGWVDAGIVRHRVAVPAADRELVDAWFRLAFGLQYVWAVRETSPERPVAADVRIRFGTPADLEATAGFDRLLVETQTQSPSFSGVILPTEQTYREEWRSTWDEGSGFTQFIAEREGRAVGHLVLYRRPTGDLRVPEQNIDLAHAATLAEVRGSGVGLALTAHALAWAYAEGFRSLTVDWRSVNLQASRFWTKRGFRPTFLRLFRRVP